MPKGTWTIAAILSLSLASGWLELCNRQKQERLDQATADLRQSFAEADELRQDLGRRRTDLASLQADLSDVRGQLKTTREKAAHLEEKLAENEARVEALRQEKEQAADRQEKLQDDMQQALASKDITISQLQGKLTVDILDRVLFDSGEARLKPEGRDVLQRLAAVLKDHPNRQVRIIGHTDNVPIRASARDRFPSNWELSTARATAAVRFLQEEAGIDPRRLGAVGFGEYHPISGNDSEAGRARNRRIAVVVLPDAWTDLPVEPADTPPPSTAPAEPDTKPVENLTGPPPSEPSASDPAGAPAEGSVSTD